MFKKLKSHSPNEFLWIVFGVLCLMLFIHISVQANIQREEQTVVTQEPTYLEIHYGNGDIYTVKTEGVVVGLNTIPAARLENEYLYRFTDTYDYKWNEASNTYILYLWRDEPYELEKQLFTKITE